MVRYSRCGVSSSPSRPRLMGGCNPCCCCGWVCVGGGGGGGGGAVVGVGVDGVGGEVGVGGVESRGKSRHTSSSASASSLVHFSTSAGGTCETGTGSPRRAASDGENMVGAMLYPVA